MAKLPLAFAPIILIEYFPSLGVVKFILPLSFNSFFLLQYYILNLKPQCRIYLH